MQIPASAPGASRLDHAASWLFVPGARPDRFAKAADAGAHEVILDLEDGVAAPDKPAARSAVAGWLAGGGTAWVRVNAAGTVWHEADLAALTACPGLRGVMVPKAEETAALSRIAERLPPGTAIVALVETARGIQQAPAIAACPAVCRLAFGSVDYALDIDADETDEALLFARSALVVASRAAGLPAPVDGVSVETTDTGIVSKAAARARSLGFGGKLCIHPAQVDPVNTAFSPSQASIVWARRVLSAEGLSTLDGKMIDTPVLERARRILARATR